MERGGGGQKEEGKRKWRFGGGEGKEVVARHKGKFDEEGKYYTESERTGKGARV